MSKMIRTVVIAVCLSLSLLLNANSATESNVNVAVVDNLTEYLSEHPEIKQLYPLEKVSGTEDGVSSKFDDTIIYRIGNRVRGDRQVAQAYGSIPTYSLQDVFHYLRYPAYGTGAVVSFVEIVVNRTPGLGIGYVTSGGIGYRHIAVVIEARRTYYFNYRSVVFGYD